MAYTRLNLQDYKDKWDAAKVTHLENGIFNNDSRLTQLQNNYNSLQNYYNNLNNSVNNLHNDISDANMMSMVSIATEVIQGLNTTGQRFGNPILSFDGVMEGKTTIPLNMGDNFLSGAYVKVSDDIIRHKEATLFTTEVGFGPLMVGIMMMDGNSSSNMEMMLLYLYFLSSIAMPAGDGAFYNLLLSEVLEMPFPVLFSQESDFEVEDTGIVYPKGTYVLCLWSGGDEFSEIEFGDLGSLEMSSMPLYCIRNVWDVNALEMPMEKLIDWNSINFNNRHTVTFVNNEIRWSGDVLPHPGLLNKISNDPKKFYEAFSKAGAITFEYENGACSTFLETDEVEKLIYVQESGSNNVHALISMGYYNVDGEAIAPGVYLAPVQSDNQLKTIKLANFNLEEFFDNKLPKDKYECLAYEESPEINLGECIHYTCGGGDILANYGDRRYDRVRENPFDKDTISNITIRKQDYEIKPSVSIEFSDKVNLTGYATIPFIEGNNALITPEVIPENTAVTAKIVFNNKIDHFNWNCYAYDDMGNAVGYYNISSIGGPTNNPEPGWAHVSATSSNMSYSDILATSFIYVCFIPNGNYLKPISFSYQASPNSILSLINSEAMAGQPECISTTDDYEIYGFNNIPYVINVFNETENLSTGVHVLYEDNTVDLNRHVEYTEIISCKDEIADVSIIHQIDSKFIPTIPTFDFTTTDMPVVCMDGKTVSLTMDTAELYAASQKGPVKIIIMSEIGEISFVTNFASFTPSENQGVFSGWFYNDTSMAKFDIVIMFTQNGIHFQIVPLGITFQQPTDSYEPTEDPIPEA